METYIPRFFKSPGQSYFLFGPRGTGKSTYLKNNFPEALWIDLLKPDVFRTYTAKPEHLIELVQGNPDKIIIVIDEIQKTPELLSAVHSLIEDYPQKQFILTGSSARKLRRKGTNLLAGRAILKNFFPFMISEIPEKYSFEFFLTHGLLPVVIKSKNAKDVLDTYAALYIREEVQQEGLVRNIGNFSRFLESISFSHASILNISTVARECEVERKVVEGYIKILEDILLGFRLPVFTKNAKRQLVAHPKFYFFDTGVFYSIRPKGPFDKPEEISGAALEGLVVQHLIAWNSYNNNSFNLYFWRTRKGVEIDFILYGEEGIFAIEVKNNNRVRSNDLKALTTFQNDYPQCKTLLLYRGTEKLIINNIRCYPCDVFFKELTPDKKLSDFF